MIQKALYKHKMKEWKNSVNYFYFQFRMLGGVAGRHMSTRRRGSSPMVRLVNNLTLSLDDGQVQPRVSPRRRRAVTTSDHKSCALIQTRLKLGDIMWVKCSVFFSHNSFDVLLRFEWSFDENSRWNGVCLWNYGYIQKSNC